MKRGEKGWEKTNDYHLTLFFIGECTEVERELIISLLQTIRFEPFALRLRSFQFFSRRVMYVAFDPSEELKELKSHIDMIFQRWLNPHSKPFLPHVTVKRWQRYEYEHLSSQVSQCQFAPMSFSVSELTLFKSEKNEFDEKYHPVFVLEKPNPLDLIV